MKLSIIICVYNTAYELVSDCLRSLTGSTLDDSSYEIVIIDDGSTVDYTALAEQYGARLVKTENRGIYQARILGIREARGEYIAYVDSDDTVSVNYHRPMLECAVESGADIVYNDWAFHTAKARYYLRRDSTISGDISCEGDAILERFLLSSGREHSYSVLWNKLFRRDLLLSVQDELSAIELPPSYNYSEDTLINFYAHKSAKTLRNIHTGYYFYRSHPAQAVSVTSKEKLISHVNNMSFTLREMKRIVNKRNNSEGLCGMVDSWAAMMSRTHYSYARAEGYTDLYEVIKEAYSVDELRPSTFSDGAVYHDTVLLAENFPDIDGALYEIWMSVGESIVHPSPDPYVNRTLDSFLSLGKPIRVEKGGRTIPAPKISLTSRILHNPLIYKLGMLLFPKGSKLRALLKRKL